MQVSINRLLFKLNELINIQIDVDFEAGRKESLRIIESLVQKPWHQGLKKYLAQVELYEPKVIMLKNIISIPLLCVTLPTILIWSLLKQPKVLKPVECLYVIAEHPLLRKISRRHAKLYEIRSFRCVNHYQMKLYADRKIALYLFSLLRHHYYLLIHPYLILIVTLKLVRYYALVVKHKPKSILSFNERSFTAPFITEFLNTHNIEHNLVMHGFRAFNVKDSFCEYDKIYVFGEYFAQLFRKMKAKTRQYCIMGHPSLDGNTLPKHSKREADTRVLLVLQKSAVISLEEINLFRDLLESVDRNYELVVKPKPGINDWLIEYLPNLREEKNKSNSIVLKDYDIFCGKHSTFLIEAWALGKKVILIGENTLPKDLLHGSTVLRLSLKNGKENELKHFLKRFLQKQVEVNWQFIEKVFSKRVYTIDESINDPK